MKDKQFSIIGTQLPKVYTNEADEEGGQGETTKDCLCWDKDLGLILNASGSL